MRARTRRHSWVVLVAGPLGVGLFGSAACNPFPFDREEPPVNCNAGDAYDLTRDWRDFDSFYDNAPDEPDLPWFESGDNTGLVACDHPDATSVPVENSELCDRVEVPCDHPDAIQPDDYFPPSHGLEGAIPEYPTDEGLCPNERRAHARWGLEVLPEGPRCGDEVALRLTGRRNNDWGSVWGDYNLAQNDTDASGYEGIALWARAAPGTQRSFTILINDKYSLNITDANGNLSAQYESACVDEEVEVEGGTQNTQLAGQANTVIPGYVPSEDACGNPYQRILTVSNRWELYLLPFDSFTQDPFPNKRPEGVDPSSLRGITIRAPKDTITDLWIDQLTFYRPIE